MCCIKAKKDEAKDTGSDAADSGGVCSVRARPLDDGGRAAIENLWLLPGHRRKPASGQSQYVIWDGNTYAISHTVGSGQLVARGAAIHLWEYPAIQLHNVPLSSLWLSP